MKPVIQTRLSKETSGNCLQASIASLLELPLDHVPNFSELYRDLDRFHATLAGWLGQRGWKLQCYKPDGDLPDDAHISWERARDLWRPMGWSLVSGPTVAGAPCDRSDFDNACEHICVAFDGEIVHDPYPGADPPGPAEVCTWWEFTRIKS